MGWLLAVVLSSAHFHEHPFHSHSSARAALELLCFLLVPGAGAGGGQQLLHVVGGFLLTPSKSLAVVPVTNQHICWRFPSHSFSQDWRKGSICFWVYKPGMGTVVHHVLFQVLRGCPGLSKHFQGACWLSAARFYLFPAPGIWI